MNEPINSTAQRIDALIEQLAQEWTTLRQALPGRAHLKAEFRQALGRFRLPGAYCRPGKLPRPLAESIKGKSEC